MAISKKLKQYVCRALMVVFIFSLGELVLYAKVRLLPLNEEYIKECDLNRRHNCFC